MRRDTGWVWDLKHWALLPADYNPGVSQLGHVGDDSGVGKGRTTRWQEPGSLSDGEEQSYPTNLDGTMGTFA